MIERLESGWVEVQRTVWAQEHFQTQFSCKSVFIDVFHRNMTQKPSSVIHHPKYCKQTKN